jgi:leader peptidase (prepilin peptidase)/N-methyltransferase
VGVALLATGRAGRKSAIPFGPFMLAGAWIAILVSSSSSVLAWLGSA